MASGAVRELITKIKFVMDKASESKANQAVQNLKKNLGNVSNRTITPKVNTQQVTGATTAVGRLIQRLKDLTSTNASVNIRSPKGMGRMAGAAKGGSGFGSELAGGLGLPFGMSAGAMAGTALAAGFVAVGAAAKSAVEKFANFDATMSKVRALTGASAADMRTLTDTARQLGATTKYSATEAAEAMTYLGMAGWKTKDIVKGMPGLLNLAAASGTDLATTADIVSDDLTAFHMSADQAGHMADVMAAASTNANTNVGLMGATFKYAGAVAGSLGYSLEDVALATGLMANAGIKGEMAGTALRSVMTRMIDPPKDAADALASLGVSVKNADGTVKPFRQQLKELRKAFTGLSKAEQAEKASSIAGLEAMSGFLSVVTAGEAEFNKLESAIDNSAGAAENMSTTMNDNLQGSVMQLENVIGDLALSFGEVLEPKARGAVDSIKDSISGLADRLSPYLSILRGPIGDTTEALEESRAEISQLEGEHPVFMQLIELFKAIGENVDKTAESVDSLGQKIENAFGNETVMEGAKTLLDVLTELSKLQGEAIDSMGLLGATPIGGVGYAVGKAILGFFEMLIDKIGELIQWGIEKLGEIGKSAAETADAMIKSIRDAVPQINAFFTELANHAVSELNRILDGLVNIEVMSDRIRIRLGENARAYRNMTNNTDVTNNITVRNTDEAASFASSSVPVYDVP